MFTPNLSEWQNWPQILACRWHFSALSSLIWHHSSGVTDWEAAYFACPIDLLTGSIKAANADSWKNTRLMHPGSRQYHLYFKQSIFCTGRNKNDIIIGLAIQTQSIRSDNCGCLHLLSFGGNRFSWLYVVWHVPQTLRQRLPYYLVNSNLVRSA